MRPHSCYLSFLVSSFSLIMLDNFVLHSFPIFIQMIRRILVICRLEKTASFSLLLRSQLFWIYTVFKSGYLHCRFKPHSHCAGVATVHPDAGQPVYRDAPGHISYKINCVLTVPTLPRCSPGSRESKTPVEPRFTTEHLRCSTVEPRFVPVYPGVNQVVYGDVPVTAGCATVTCR